MRRMLLLPLAAAALLAAPVRAEAADVVLVANEVRLGAATAGKAKAEVTLLNVGDAPVTVTVAPGAGTAAGCTFAMDGDATVPVARQRTVTVAATGCGDVVRFTLTAGTRPFDVTATRDKAAPKPDWGKVSAAFTTAFLGSLVLVLGLWTYAGVTGRTDRVTFEKGWKFSDSWASNATVFSAAFTGFFGASGVMKAVLGDKGEAVVAALTVASAVAVGLAGGASLLVTAMRKVHADGVVSLGLTSFFLSALLTLMGVAGVLLSTAFLVDDLPLGGPGLLVPWLILASLGLLVTYAIRSVRAVVAKPPAPTGPADRGFLDAAPAPRRGAALL